MTLWSVYQFLKILSEGWGYFVATSTSLYWPLQLQVPDTSQRTLKEFKVIASWVYMNRLMSTASGRSGAKCPLPWPFFVHVFCLDSPSLSWEGVEVYSQHVWWLQQAANEVAGQSTVLGKDRRMWGMGIQFKSCTCSHVYKHQFIHQLKNKIVRDNLTVTR